ncbi:hypothetical protein C8Q80DRAFT_1125429 [Daedaleopsis nitida]|nr:hypothetical protein C8Q80DRAFT_1125429 [Daedaleopsis nitida]
MEPGTPSSTESDTVLVTPPVSPRRDDEFYCRDIVFQVENVLFKVARRPFEQDSSAFASTFSLPSQDHAHGVEGGTDEHPIYLAGVTEAEFRSLLRVLFPPPLRTLVNMEVYHSISTNVLFSCLLRAVQRPATRLARSQIYRSAKDRLYSPISHHRAYGASRALTQEQWTHVLRLSSMWFFDAIREKAISELARLVRSPVVRIVLARTHAIPTWIEPALIQLAQQDTLAITDLEPLGWAMAAKLVRVRDSVAFTTACLCACQYCNHAHGAVAGAGVHGQGPNAHANQGHAQSYSPGTRPTATSAATVRKTFDFSQKIREVYGTDLY